LPFSNLIMELTYATGEYARLTNRVSCDYLKVTLGQTGQVSSTNNYTVQRESYEPDEFTWWGYTPPGSWEPVGTDLGGEGVVIGCTVYYRCVGLQNPWYGVLINNHTS